MSSSIASTSSCVCMGMEGKRCKTFYLMNVRILILCIPLLEEMIVFKILRVIFPKVGMRIVGYILSCPKVVGGSSIPRPQQCIEFKFIGFSTTQLPAN